MSVSKCNLQSYELSEYTLIRDRAAIITLLALATLAALFPIASRSPYFMQSFAGIALIYSLSTFTSLALFSFLNTLYKIYFISLQLQPAKELQNKNEEPQLPPLALDRQEEPPLPAYPREQNVGEAVVLVEEPPLQQNIPEAALVEDDPIDPAVKNLADYAQLLTIIRNHLSPFLQRLSGDNVTCDLFNNLINHIIADLPRSTEINKQMKEGDIRHERKILQEKQEKAQKKLQKNHDSLLHNAERLLPEHLENEEKLEERRYILLQRTNLLEKRKELLESIKRKARQREIVLMQAQLEQEKNALPAKLAQLEEQLRRNQQSIVEGALVVELSNENQNVDSLDERLPLLQEQATLEARQREIETTLKELAEEASQLEIFLRQVEEDLQSTLILVQEQLQQERHFIAKADTLIPNKIEGLVGLSGLQPYALQDIERIQIEITRVIKSRILLLERSAIIRDINTIRRNEEELNERWRLLHEEPQEPIDFPIINEEIAFLQQPLTDETIYHHHRGNERFKENIQRVANELAGGQAAALHFPSFPIQPPAVVPRNRFVYLAHIFRLLTVAIPFAKNAYEHNLNNLDGPARIAAKAALNQPNVTKKTAINFGINRMLAELKIQFPDGVRSPSDPAFDYIQKGDELARALISNVIDKYFNVGLLGFGLSDRAFDDLKLLIPILNNLSEVALQLSEQQEPYTQEQLAQAVVNAALIPLNQTLWH